jgi:hypothetical protein
VGQPKEEWIAPSGCRMGAFFMLPVEYEALVLAFFGRYLRAA